MEKNDPGINDIHKEIKRLKKRISHIEKQATDAKNKSADRKSACFLNDLKSSLAWQYLDLGEYETGLVFYKELPWQTHGEEKYNGICRALIEMEYYDEAGKLLERGLKRFPESHMLLVGKGLLLRRLGYEFDALKCFERALEFAPDDRHALYDRALALNGLGHYEDTLPILKNLIEAYPDDPEYLVEMGYACLNSGLPEDSIPFYRKAQDMGYLSPGIYGGLCCAYMDLGMKHEAIEIAAEGIKKLPDKHPGLYENLAEGYKECGWINEAHDVLHDGLKKFPDDERLEELLQEIEDEIDNPDKDKKPPIIGLMFLLTLLKKLSERPFKK